MGPDDQMPDMVVGDTTSETPTLEKINPGDLEFLKARQLNLMRTTVTIQTPTVTLSTAPVAAASTRLADFEPEHLMERQAMVDPEEVPTDQDWWSWRSW